MSSLFVAFTSHYELFESQKSVIINAWTTDSYCVALLSQYEIDKDYFSEYFAVEVVDYFFALSHAVSEIDETPFLKEFLKSLSRQGVTTPELFTLCTKLRKAIVAVADKADINSETIYNDITSIFEYCFTGVLELFNKRAREVESECKEARSLLSQYKKAIDYSSLVSKTDANGVITYVNDAFCQVSGYTKRELIGRRHNVIRHPDMSNLFFEDLWNTIKSGKVFHDTIKNRAKDGKSYFVDTVISPFFDEYENIKGYISIRQDVTEMLASVEGAIIAEESALKAKEEALLAEKSKDDFLSNMSHEIRTPLNAILGFVQLLEKSDLSVKDRGYLDIISNSGNSLLSLINDILDFAKIRSGEFHLDPFEFDPLYEFENTVELFTSKINEKGIDYLVYIDPCIPKLLNADAIRIKQVLLNFLGNALKFTPDYGSIRVKILYDKSKEILSLYVKDNGIGIKSENQKKIFSAFSQEDMDTSRRFGGTGLGLAISQSLTTLMKGEIGLESKEGEGSTFFSHIPVKMVQERSLWGLSDKIALYSQDIMEDEFNLLSKYLKNMNIPFEKVSNISDGLHAKYMIIPASYYENTMLKKKHDSLIKGTKVILLDQIDSNYALKTEDKDRLYLPLNPTKIVKILEEKPQVEVKPKEVQQYEGTILIAEDNKTNQMLITILLDGFNIKYTLAENGAEAFENFKNSRFDLILMDNNMPIMSGLEATEKILAYEEEKALQHTPIIALTANASNADRERFLSSGMSDFLSKPLDVRELERVLDNYLIKKQKIKSKTSSNKKGSKKLQLKIDYKALSVKLGLSRKMINTLVESFLSEMPEILEKLQEAVASQDMKNIELHAHSIKGSSANLSLDILQNLAEDLEIEAQNNRNDYNYQEAFDRLVSLFKTLKKRA